MNGFGIQFSEEDRSEINIVRRVELMEWLLHQGVGCVMVRCEVRCCWC